MRTLPAPSRRAFLRRSAGGLAAWAALRPAAMTRAHEHLESAAGDSRTPEELARDEGFWRPIQDAWDVDRSLLNLNNGGVSPPLRCGLESFQRLAEFSYQAPAYYMWRTLEPQKERVRRQLARHFGADPEEIAIVRNASEALETAIFGIDLKAGDEVLSTDQDYPRMVAAWRQRARREGIVFRQLELPMGADGGPAAVLEAFRRAMTERTKVVLFCHTVNLTGQVLPVKALCALAREHGALSIVDGAHSFAHVAFDGTDLGCDYYGTSLHKWYSAPIGTGMLYVRRKCIARTWPLFAADESLDDDVRKFEQIGTHSVPLFLAIGEAARFHDGLGAARKEARLRRLRELWSEPLLDDPRVRFHQPEEDAASCGLATVQIEGVETGELASYLLRAHRIVVTGIQHERFHGIRVSPHLYTTPEELEQFAAAMRRVLREGLPT